MSNPLLDQYNNLPAIAERVRTERAQSALSKTAVAPIAPRLRRIAELERQLGPLAKSADAGDQQEARNLAGELALQKLSAARELSMNAAALAEAQAHVTAARRSTSGAVAAGHTNSAAHAMTRSVAGPLNPLTHREALQSVTDGTYQRQAPLPGSELPSLRLNHRSSTTTELPEDLDREIATMQKQLDAELASTTSAAPARASELSERLTRARLYRAHLTGRA